MAYIIKSLALTLPNKTEGLNANTDILTGLALLFNAHASTSYWVDAFTWAVYIINRLPTKLHKAKSPFEVLFATSPNYDVFCVFGCRVFPYLRDYAIHKIAPQSIACIFIGYSTRYKGYCCLDPTTNRIYTTRHAQFDEHIFPFADSSSSSDLNLLSFTSFDEPLSSSPTQPQADNSSPYEDSPMTLHHYCSLCPPVAPSPVAKTAATDASSMMPHLWCQNHQCSTPLHHNPLTSGHQLPHNL